MAEQLPLTLITPSGERFEFETYEEIADWASEEIAVWEGLKQIQANLGSAGPDAVGRQLAGFTNIRSTLNAIQSDPNNAPHLDTLRRQLVSIHEGNTVVSTSPTGRKIVDLISTAPEKALALLIWHLPGANIAFRQNENIEPLLKAMIDARLDERDGVGDVSAETAALADLRDKWERSFAAIRDSQNDLEREFEHWASVTMATVADRIRRAKSLARNVVGRFRKTRDDHDEQMAAIRESFRAELSLREPASYWTTKADSHFRYAVRGFLGLIGAAVSIGMFVVVGPKYLLTEEVTGSLQYGSALLIAFPALALFWIMKALSRIFVSNLQLLGDARLRSTMVTTFVSLMENPRNQMTEEDRILILQALFRPAGADAQDEAPPNWFDVLLRRVDKQGS